MNIELHGLRNIAPHGDDWELRGLIFAKLKEIAKPEVFRQTVISISDTQTIDAQGIHAPFIRIFSDHPEHFAVAVGALKRITVLMRNDPPIGVECVGLSEYHEL